MHRDEDVRREVAGRILAAWGRLADDHDRRNSDDRVVAFDDATNDEPGTRPGSSHSCCRAIASEPIPHPHCPSASAVYPADADRHEGRPY